MAAPKQPAVAGNPSLGSKRRAVAPSEDGLAALLDTMHVVVFRTDAAGRWEFLSGVWETAFGFRIDDCVGAQATEVVLPQDRDTLSQLLLRGVLTPSDPRENLVHVSSPRLGLRCLQVFARPRWDHATAAVVGTYGALLDVTERLQYEEALLRESQTNQALLRNASDGIHILDEGGHLVDFSESFCRMLGYAPTEMLGLHVSAWEAQHSRQEVMDLVRAQFRNLERSQFETRHRRKDGSVIEVEVSGLPLELADKRLLFNCSRDITERKAMQRALERQLSYSQALGAIARTLVESDDSEHVLERTVDILGETLAADRALIYDVNFDTHQASALCEWLNPRHADIDATRANYPLALFKNAVDHMRRTRSFLVSQRDDINPYLVADGSSGILHSKMAIRSLLWYPFAFRENGFFAIALNQTHSRKEWDADELVVLDSVAHLVSVALDKARLVEQRNADLNALRVAATAFEAQEGVMITDERVRIVRVNRAFTRITGYGAAEVIGRSPRVLQSGRQDKAFYARMWRELRESGTWDGEIWNRRKNGEAYPEHLRVSVVRNLKGDVTNYVATFSDISERKSAEEEIKILALYDPLTQLPNRRHLIERLSLALASAVHAARYGALLYVDLDDFQALNDTLGHDQGDLLLQQVALRISSTLDEDGTVARFGGDEFMVLLGDLGPRRDEAAMRAGTVAERILAALDVPVALAATEARATPSIGITLLHADNAELGELLKQADIAMYQAKRAGRNTFRFFDPPMQDVVNRRVSLEGELRRALEQRQFLLYFQPQVDATDRVFGAEALLRWLHPERGLVPPAHFIALAEENGLILPIGQWVIENACEHLTRWARDPRTRELQLCVNVSARQFRQAQFAESVIAAMQLHGVDPARLKLEITETALLGDIDEAVATMERLRRVGVGFSLDDFGTGFSSLQYLRRLPLNQLKIDRSFVRDIAVDESDRAIVSTIIAMARTLELDVIAEGVETTEQRNCLERAGCLQVQGYLTGRPMPLEQFETFLRQHTT